MMQEQLKLKFGDCKFAAISDCKGSYENSSEEEFAIYDPPNELNEPVQVVSLDKEHQLKVSNANKNQICVVKTDKCLFTDAVSKCDCILFDNYRFYFVEIKDSKTSQRHANRKTAVAQLSATIDIMIANGIDLTTLATKAIICFKSLSAYPIRTSFLSEKAVFKETYNISLEEGNKIEF